jgi:hypothetical protein
VYKTCKLYVPAGSVDKYKVENEWKKFFDNNNIFVEGMTTINPINKEKIAILPYPNGIAIKTKEPVSVSIYHTSGQKVYESVVAGDTEIGLDKGIYIVKVNNESTKVIVP